MCKRCDGTVSPKESRKMENVGLHIVFLLAVRSGEESLPQRLVCYLLCKQETITNAVWWWGGHILMHVRR